MSDIFNTVIWNLSKENFEHCTDIAKRCGRHHSTIRKALNSLYQGDLVEMKEEGPRKKKVFRNKQIALDFELGKN